MRRLLVASVVAAGLAGALAHSPRPEDAAVRRRKTLGFGPEHPHAAFHSGAAAPVPQFQAFSDDPYQVAREFLEGHSATPGSSYFIRDDSYTDTNSGITHIYARQTVYGIEVADGDVNLNIKNGRVLSYGDSVRVPSGRVSSGC